MIPTANLVAADEGRQQPGADAGHERANNREENIEVKAIRRNMKDKLLELLMGLNKRMRRMTRCKRRRSVYIPTIVFGSMLGGARP